MHWRWINESLLDKKKKKGKNYLSFLEALHEWLFACLLYICGDVFVDCAAISFQSDLF